MIDSRQIFLTIHLFLFLVLFSCSRGAAPDGKTLLTNDGAGGGQTISSKPEAGWQADWEKTVKAGQREGRFAVHTSYSGEVTRALMSAFKEKYGIDAEFISGRGAELRARFFSERRAGIYAVDLIFRGASGMIADQKPAGALDPLDRLLVLPEVIDPKAWWGGKLNWSDDEHYILSYLAYPSGQLAINKGVVNLDEMKSWRDILLPKWKGKITINDPTTTGSGNAWFHAMSTKILGMDYMRELVKQEPVLLRDIRLQGEWLATGKYPLAIGSTGNVIPELQRAGAPVVEKMLAEGGYITAGSGAISFVNKAPHPNAAKVFANWVLTREAQILISKIYRGQSARVDIPTDFLPSEYLRQPGVKYIDKRDEKSQIEEAKYTEVARELFAPLLK